ncbi:hypothetical protein [Nesterenkonia sp. PF2B19]|uniref:hypothetical protein n=1 Tax=Nesterenkonia sp. PF2B19 TaxID=1881858 RepID=UPI00148343A5|nr:hypothetical protein [Nesterenkonia sp. PF2B19]
MEERAQPGAAAAAVSAVVASSTAVTSPARNAARQWAAVAARKSVMEVSVVWA